MTWPEVKRAKQVFLEGDGCSYAFWSEVVSERRLRGEWAKALAEQISCRNEESNDCDLLNLDELCLACEVKAELLRVSGEDLK